MPSLLKTIKAKQQSAQTIDGPCPKQSHFVVVLLLSFLVFWSQMERLSLGSYMAETKQVNSVAETKQVNSASSQKTPEDPNLVCFPWEEDSDPWWQMHPEWEPHGENATHTCFHPIPNQNRSKFYREIYQNQYHGKDCSQLNTRILVMTGYAATINRLAVGFWQAIQRGHPFQTQRHWEGAQWLYSPRYINVTAEERSWAACPTQDDRCYFLPITNCVSTPSYQDTPIRKQIVGQQMRVQKNREQFLWMTSYLTRPKHIVRKHLLDLMKEEAPTLGEGPCTWIHVRRGDATSEKFARNFYPLNEYLERGNVSTADNILLLTDDSTTIDEANLLYPQYKWNYWNRTRNRGKVKKNSHIPSNDKAKELLAILGELSLAGQCQKGVHGTSNMVEMFKMEMTNHYGLANIELIQIDNELKNEPGDAAQFVKDLEVKLEAARKQQHQA